MSFVKTVFGRRMPDKFEYAMAMEEMASESERTYRGMIDLYNSEVEAGMLSAPSGSIVTPTGRGIYKARLFGAMFMSLAYAKATQSQAEGLEMFNIASGVAVKPLLGQSAPRLGREEAKSFTMDYVISATKAMVAAFEAGPLVPGAAQQGHIALANHLHDALVESFGVEGYTTEIRERFTILVEANTAMAMNHARKWMIQ